MTPEANSTTGRSMLLVILVAAALRLFLLVAVTPDHENREARFIGFNDEPAHYNYVRYLTEQFRLPVQTARITDDDAFQAYEFEYYQPPLYYLAAAPDTWLAEKIRPGLGLYAARLVSVVLSLLTLCVLARFLREFVPLPEAWIGIPLFLALLQGHARFSAQVNNDNLLWLLAAVATLLLFRALAQGGGDGKIWALLGLVAGLGLLTKTSALTLMAGPVLGLLAARRDRAAVRSLGIYFGVALALAAPWWLRNKLLYDEWLAVSVAVGEPRTEMGAEFFDRLWVLHVKRVGFHFWSGFENRYSTDFLQIVVPGLLVVSLAILAVGIRYWLRRFGDRKSWPEVRPFFWAALGTGLGNLAGYAVYVFRYDQSEIRHMFPSLVAWIYLLLMPLYATAPAARRRVVTVVLAICALLPWIGFLL